MEDGGEREVFDPMSGSGCATQVIDIIIAIQTAMHLAQCSVPHKLLLTF